MKKSFKLFFLFLFTVYQNFFACNIFLKIKDPISIKLENQLQKKVRVLVRAAKHQTFIMIMMLEALSVFCLSHLLNDSKTFLYNEPPPFKIYFPLLIPVVIVNYKLTKKVDAFFNRLHLKASKFTSKFVKENIEQKIKVKPKYLITECSICLDEFENNQKFLYLPCKHYFCVNCINRWLLSHDFSCPTCKREFSEEDIIDIYKHCFGNIILDE